MPLSRMIDGILRPIIRLTIVDGNAPRRLRTLKRMEGGVLRTIATFVSEMSARTDTPSAFGAENSKAPVTVMSGGVTCIVTGGEGPYTYAWTVVSDGGIEPTAPTNAKTRFVALVGMQSASGTGTCVVTDRFGTTASASVTILLTNAGFD